MLTYAMQSKYNPNDPYNLKQQSGNQSKQVIENAKRIQELQKKVDQQKLPVDYSDNRYYVIKKGEQDFRIIDKYNPIIPNTFLKTQSSADNEAKRLNEADNRNLSVR